MRKRLSHGEMITEDFDTETLEIRRLFFKILDEEAPQVKQDLYDAVLPHYKTIYFNDSLQKWAEKYHLHKQPWILTAAKNIIYSWYSTVENKPNDLYKEKYQNYKDNTNGTGLSFEAWLKDDNLRYVPWIGVFIGVKVYEEDNIPGWEIETETKEAFRKRIERYIKDKEEKAYASGAKKTMKFGKVQVFNAPDVKIRAFILYEIIPAVLGRDLTRDEKFDRLISAAHDQEHKSLLEHWKDYQDSSRRKNYTKLANCYNEGKRLLDWKDN